MARPTYATVEQLQAATDFKTTGYEGDRLKRLLESASALIDRKFHRHFYPLTETRTYTDPYFVTPRRTTSTGFWLEADLQSLSSATVDTVSQTVGDIELYSSTYGPPYSWAGVTGSTIVLVGVWGYTNDTETAGTITANIGTSSATTCACSDSSAIGLGDLITINSERMIVTGKAMLDTGVDFSSGGTTAAVSDNAITMDGAGLLVGETILADAEKMLIVEYNSATEIATVKRGYDGSVLATHTTPSVYAPRTLTITRGATGSTAATHTSADAITRNTPPPLISSLCVAEAIVAYEQEASGYARVVGSGDNAREARGVGLDAIRKDASVYQRRRWAVV